MNHKGSKRIETERLILREFTIEDAIPAYENWTSDPEVTKYLTWRSHSSLQVTEDILKDWTRQYRKDDFYQWAIELKELGQVIGSISVVDQKENIKMVQIGYCIGQKWWKQGMTTEALKVLIKFFFEEVGANRIEARFDPSNPNSGKVMAKAGMKYEGTLRQADSNMQGVCDISYYGMIASDYFD